MTPVDSFPLRSIEDGGLASGIGGFFHRDVVQLLPRPIVAGKPSRLQQLRQLGDVGSDASRFVNEEAVLYRQAFRI
jgi:hypothetical protein